MQPGYVIAGRVQLADGKPAGENLRVVLARDGLPDTQQAPVDAQGQFRFVGVPGETITLADDIKVASRSDRNSMPMTC